MLLSERDAPMCFRIRNCTGKHHPHYHQAHRAIRNGLRFLMEAMHNDDVRCFRSCSKVKANKNRKTARNVGDPSVIRRAALSVVIKERRIALVSSFYEVDTVYNEKFSNNSRRWRLEFRHSLQVNKTERELRHSFSLVNGWWVTILLLNTCGSSWKIARKRILRIEGHVLCLIDTYLHQIKELS